MNQGHLDYCASPEWAAILRERILPWALDGRDLGDDVVEVGAGPGLSTDVLRQRVPRLTAVELDADLAAALRDRLTGTNVTVVTADATDLPLPTDRFSSATCFTMLHHVPSTDLQDRLLAELCRVLRPGGLLVGSDSLASPDLRAFHAGDVYLPVDAATLPARLTAAGFADPSVDLDPEGRFRFSATARSGPGRGGRDVRPGS